MPKPLASVSLDLDNKWSYMKTHGDAGWESHPSYLDVVVPRALKFFAERKLTITFFVVGQDAAIESNHEALAQIAWEGHEIGNHSFHHEPWLHLYSRDQIEQELAAAEENIERATGQRPRGFRGPGFSLSNDVLDVLARRGYIYDASTFPTFIGPLARAYYFMKSRLDPAGLKQRRALFGTVRDGLRPIHEYRWHTPTGDLLEIPVTTVPLLRIPFHASYILYLASFSKPLALAYFRFALWACRISGVRPSLLLHPLDFMGCDDTTDLSFFPAMNMKSGVKLELMGKILGAMSKHYTLVNMRKHAESMGTTSLTATVPNFSSARP